MRCSSIFTIYTCTCTIMYIQCTCMYLRVSLLKWFAVTKNNSILNLCTCIFMYMYMYIPEFLTIDQYMHDGCVHMFRAMQYTNTNVYVCSVHLIEVKREILITYDIQYWVYGNKTTQNIYENLHVTWNSGYCMHNCVYKQSKKYFRYMAARRNWEGGHFHPELIYMYGTWNFLERPCHPCKLNIF